jgi:CBS domain containing-hemolysin-like protein
MADLRSGTTSIEEIAAEPMAIQADTTISDAVDAFQENNQELALVRESAGGEVIGLITATDALEAVMGEIEDPLDIALQDREDGPRHQG